MRSDQLLIRRFTLIYPLARNQINTTDGRLDHRCRWIITTSISSYLIHSPIVGQWTQSEDFAAVIVRYRVDVVEHILDARHGRYAVCFVLELEVRIEHFITEPALHVGLEKALIEVIRDTA